MRVLLIPELYPTDENPVAGVFINDHIKAIQKFADVVVYNTNPFYRGVYKHVQGVEYFDFHLFSQKPVRLLKPLLYRFWESRALQLALKIPSIDIVHVHGSALRGEIARKFANNRKIPFAVTEHTGPWTAISSRPTIFSRVKKVLKSADLVMPVSNHLKNEMLNSGVEMHKAEVLGNPVDGDLYRLRSSELGSQKRILFVGRLDEFKGGMRTLRAFHSICGSKRDWKLLILGKGAEGESIKTYIKNHNLSDCVEFIERVFDRRELVKYYHQSSFLVFPSRFESFGLVAAEALSTGLPVLCTNKTGPLDYTLSENSIAINPDSIEDIATGMLTMIRAIDKFKHQQIRSSIINNFGIESYADKLKSAYRALQ